MVSLIQTTIATILGPLMAEQAALRQSAEQERAQPPWQRSARRTTP
jgi:hypothetical protein